MNRLLALRTGGLALLFGLSANIHAATVIALIADGPSTRPLISAAALQQEIDALTEGEFVVRLPEDKRLDGGWTLDGIRAAIRAALADPAIDMIICRGIIACNELAGWPSLSKPVIAPVVADARFQSFPLKDGASGKKNFVYITNFQSLDADLGAFQEAVPFKKLAFLAERVTAESIEGLREDKVRDLELKLGIEAIPVSTTGSVDDFLAGIPADAEVVYVTPLLRFGPTEMRRLADGLIERKLPSFSLLGFSEVEMGLLLADSGRPEDYVRLTRRIAVNVQRILLGEEPGEIQVGLQSSRRLAINMETAAAIGFAPRYAVLADAEQLFRTELSGGREVTLNQALNAALEANLNLQVVEFDPQIADEDARTARAELLPQFELSADGSAIDDDRANPFVRAERSVDGELAGRQVIYSDDAWAGYRTAQYLQQATDQEFRLAALDTLRIAGSSYLGLLRALALESVQRSNLEVTRANLGLARVRESIGFSGRADVLRWESQIARDRRNLIDSEAARRQAGNRLNQVLNLPQSEIVKPLDSSVELALGLFTAPRFQALIDNVTTWTTFLDFVVERAVRTTPELKRLDLLTLAGERRVTAAQRRYWLPEFAVEGFGGRNFYRGGAGSDVGAVGIDDNSWGVGVGLSLPIFSGGALRADLNRSRLSLRQLERQRAAVEQDVETRVRISMEAAASSFSAIELTADAARAASENLDLITDSYSKGAKSVTDLIDAQNAALAAELSAAEAKYIYLNDVLTVLRDASDFSLLLDPQYANDWFAEVQAYFQARGVKLN